MEKNESEPIERQIKLDLIHAFGSSTSLGLRDSVGIIEEGNQKLILYPVGKYIALKQIDKQNMSFIQLNESLEQIVSMAISPNKKFMAICEKIKDEDDSKKKYPNVTVYNIKQQQQKSSDGNEKKVFTYSETSTSYFIAMAFSTDSRFLVCLTGEPEYKLVFIDLLANKKNLAGTIIQQPINKISIKPSDNHMVAVSGPNMFRILRVQESSFVNIADKIKNLPQQSNYTDHCWFDEERIAVCNDKGQIFIITNNEVIQKISSGFEQQGTSIVCVQPFSKGLIIGSDAGQFALWLKDEDPQKLMKRKEGDFELVFLYQWSSQRNNQVVSIDISSNDEYLVAGFKNNDVATFPLQKIIPSVPENLEQMKKNLKNIEKKVKMEYIFEGSHYGPITQMDICLQRPLIATCSAKDQTIRIWNYMSQKCELVRVFKSDGNVIQEIIQSISFHPSGYYLAAGFVDKIRIFHVLYDNLQKYREIIQKYATFLKFSNGGQYLAAASPVQYQKSTHYHIIIYNSYTLEPLQTLKGHTNKIMEVIWGPKDEFILSCSCDGSVYEWSTYSTSVSGVWVRKDRLVSNQAHLSSILFNEPTDLTMVAGGDGCKGVVQEIKPYSDNREDSYSSTTYQLNNYRITNFQLIRSIYNFVAIIAGTSLGQIKVFPHIFAAIPFETIPVHNGEVNQIRVSADGRYVFSAGEDGILFVFQVSEITSQGDVITAKSAENKEGGMEELNPKATCVSEELAEIVLIHKQKLEGYVLEQENLHHQFEEFKEKMDQAEEENRKKTEKIIQDLNQKKDQEILNYKRELEKIVIQKDFLERESKRLLEEMEKTHLRAAEDIENLYDKKVGFEHEKLMQKEQEQRENKMKFEERIKQLELRHDQNLVILKKEFNDNFSKAQKVYESMRSTAEIIKQTYVERLIQSEEEHELEIRQLITKQMEEEENFQKKIVGLQTQEQALKQRYQTAKDEQDKLEREKKEQLQIITELEKKKQEIVQERDLVLKEKNQKEETIREKEKNIHNLKLKISDLQRWKHVLSFRTTEMRKSLEPKESQIEKLKEELFKLEGEFEEMLKNSTVQNEKMQKMQIQIDSDKQNLMKQDQENKKNLKIIDDIITDIHNCVKQKDMKLWGYEMQLLYQKYVLEQKIQTQQTDVKSVDEMEKHIVHLEKSILQMNKSSGKVVVRREKEIHKKTKENAELIYDLNDMRKENKEQIADINNKKLQIDSLRKENSNLKAEIIKLTRMLNKAQKRVTSVNDQQIIEQDLAQNLQLSPQSDLIKQQPFSQSMKLLSQKGKIIKGSNFDVKTMNTFDKAKMMDLMVEVELSKQKLLQQDSALTTLRDKVKKHLQDHQCNDQLLVNEINLGQYISEMQQNDDANKDPLKFPPINDAIQNISNNKNQSLNNEQ